MITEVTTGIQSLNSAMSLIKTMNAAFNQATVNEVKLALQAQIFDAYNALTAAQAAQTAALDRIRELEQEIVKLKDWEGEKQRYHLKAVDTRAFAYSLKAGMESGEPSHWLCTECFNRGHRSILQFRGTTQGLGRLGLQAIWICAACSNQISVSQQITPQTGQD